MTEFQAGDIVECVRWNVSIFKAGRFYAFDSRTPQRKPTSTHCGPTAVATEGGEFRLAFRPPAGEVWTPWNGGECPVPAGSPLYVCHRDGEVFATKAGESQAGDWSHDPCRADVIAYRLMPAERDPLMDVHLAVNQSITDALKSRDPIEPSRIKVGDEVMVRVPVVAVDASSIMVASGWLSFSLVVSHTPKPKPLEVGDSVCVGETCGRWTIIAIDGDTAWIKTTMPGKPSCFAKLSDLTRIEDAS